jgi:hypothetical protein
VSKIRTFLSKYALGKVNFASSRWRGKMRRKICARKSGNNCLQRNECPLFLEMAIKMPSKVEHEIERWARLIRSPVALSSKAWT